MSARSSRLAVVAQAERPTVLVCLGAFWHGNDASGPNQSFKAFATRLADEFDVRLIARDRPFGAAKPLAGPPNEWHHNGFALAHYLEPGRLGARGLKRVIDDTPHDALVLNGFFDSEFTIPLLVMRKVGAIARRPVLLSPRGEFSQQALGLKSLKKRSYLAGVHACGLVSDVVLHGTSDAELHDIKAGCPGAAGYVMAPNIRLALAQEQHRPSADGRLRLAFVGRISPVKNLDFALAVLSAVRANVKLDIFGPIEDRQHWNRCLAQIAALPGNISAAHHGEVPSDRLPSIFAATDLFFMPSRSENFGHAIFEALSGGVPVLIGNRTPWRDLEAASAGFDLPLDQPDRFAAAIDRFASLGAAERAVLMGGARALASRYVAASDAVARNRSMLRRLVCGVAA